MTSIKFVLNNSGLFEKIIKIVRKHDGNFTAMQDDFRTTELIMKEIEKWDKETTRITPLCSAVIFTTRDMR